MTTFTQITSPPQAQSEVIVNDALDVLSAVAVYGLDVANSSGLTWGYFGGRWQGHNVTASTLTLTTNATNYVVVQRSTGNISTSTSSTNHSNTTDYALVYTVTTVSGVVTAAVDERLDSGGVLAAGSGGGGGGAPDRSGVSVLTPSAGVVNIDCSLGDYFTLAPTANVTSITFSNLPASGHGASLMIRFTQDSTARTVVWPSSFKWAGGTPGAVSTGSGAVDLIAITSFDQGTSWRVTLAKAFA